jgi:hypothetical protein
MMVLRQPGHLEIWLYSMLVDTGLRQALQSIRDSFVLLTTIRRSEGYDTPAVWNELTETVFYFIFLAAAWIPYFEDLDAIILLVPVRCAPYTYIYPIVSLIIVFSF